MALPIDKASPRPCKECPFMKGSAPGWLGPWPDSDTLHMHIAHEHDFACHMTISDDDEDSDEFPEGARRCTGSVMYATKNCKRFHDPVLKAEQERLKPIDEVMNMFEMREHHAKKKRT